MNTKFFKKITRGALVALSLVATLGLGSCSMEKDDVALGAQGGEAIVFNAEMVDPSGVDTKGALYDNSTFTEFYVYAANISDDGEVDWFMDGVKIVKQNDNSWMPEGGVSYIAPTDGENQFFGISAQAPIDKTNSDVTLAEKGIAITKYTTNKPTNYTGYLAAQYTTPDNFDYQPSFMFTDADISDGSSLSFEFKPHTNALRFTSDGDYTIDELTVSNVVLSRFYYWNSGAFTSSIRDFDANKSVTVDGGYVNVDDENENAYLMLPSIFYLYEIKVSATLSHTDESGTTTKEVSYTLPQFDSSIKSATYFTVNLSTGEFVEDTPELAPAEGDDYTTKSDGNSDSNCYIVNPTTAQRVYHFPVQGRINDYWGNYANVSANTIDIDDLSTLTVAQLWSDCSIAAAGDGTTDLGVTLVEGADSEVAMQVVVPASYSKAGNAVYAVKKADGTILWSWHLWVTSYNPTGTCFDRFIGQKTTNSLDGATLYQFGRKDPFTSSELTISSTSTVQSSIQNPTVAYSNGSHSWCASGLATEDYIWGDKNKKYTAGANNRSKSIFDPSPYGYCVADYKYMDQYDGDYYDYMIIRYNDYYLDEWYGIKFFNTISYTGTSYGSYNESESAMWLCGNPNDTFGNVTSSFYRFTRNNSGSLDYEFAGYANANVKYLLPV
ncbi:MAG: hypothetical protein R3Y50_09370 [Rikenellaceae bacterium]